MKKECRTLVIACVISFLPLVAMTQSEISSARYITLGTGVGPFPNAERSQPANAIVRDDDAWLLDVGDGAALQLAKAGFGLHQLRAIFISHLHFDHTGGLGAILGLRHQTDVPEGPITIYGPIGIRESIEGLLAYVEAGKSVGIGAGRPTPGHDIEIVELSDGFHAELDGFTVTAAENSHFSPMEGFNEQPVKTESFSFRFDFPERSIVYTGDTGPSAAVEELARGADLLVSELYELTRGPTRNDSRRDSSRRLAHLDQHHLTSQQAGELAARANVRKLVITHNNVPPSPEQVRMLEERIRAHFDGEVVIANDLDQF